MLNWPAKDPDETLDFRVDWSDRLSTDTIVSSVWVLATAAGLTEESNTFTGTTATIWLSGGTAGSTAVIVNRVTTLEDRVFEETITLPIAASTLAPASGYTAPTASDLKARFPAFAATDVGAIEAALADAARMVDSSWLEGDFVPGRLLYAAHVLTLDGHGTSAEAQAAASGNGGFKVMKSGSLTLERFAPVGNSAADLMASTSFGKRFLDLLRKNRSGPVVALGANSAESLSGLAGAIR